MLLGINIDHKSLLQVILGLRWYLRLRSQQYRPLIKNPNKNLFDRDNLLNIQEWDPEYKVYLNKNWDINQLPLKFLLLFWMEWEYGM